MAGSWFAGAAGSLACHRESRADRCRTRCRRGAGGRGRRPRTGRRRRRPGTGRRRAGRELVGVGVGGCRSASASAWAGRRRRRRVPVGVGVGVVPVGVGVGAVAVGVGVGVVAVGVGVVGVGVGGCGRAGRHGDRVVVEGHGPVTGQCAAVDGVAGLHRDRGQGQDGAREGGICSECGGTAHLPEDVAGLGAVGEDDGAGRVGGERGRGLEDEDRVRVAAARSGSATRRPPARRRPCTRRARVSAPAPMKAGTLAVGLRPAASLYAVVRSDWAPCRDAVGACARCR